MKKLPAGFFLGSAAIVSLLALPFVALAATITISSDTQFATTNHWTPDNAYVISGSRTLGSGKTLTIYASTTVKFANSSSALTISGGTLTAQGTTSPIYFTSYKDDTGGDTNGDGLVTTAAPGDWQKIVVSSGGSITLDNVIVRYGGAGSTALSNLYNNGGYLTITNSTSTLAGNFYGAHGLYHGSGTTTMSTSTISENAYGVRSGSASGSLTLANVGFINNSGRSDSYLGKIHSNLEFHHSGNSVTGTGALNGFLLDGGVTTDRTWEADLIAYVIDGAAGALTVSSGATLTIDPGAVVKFKGTNASLSINGTLNALGASTSRVIFTSIHDDQAGIVFDTNGNGSSTLPAAGDWTGLKMNSGGTANVYHAILRYGGYGSASSTGMVWNNGGTLNLHLASVASSTSNGIYNSSGTTNASNLNLAYNKTGVFMSGGTVTATTSYIYYNQNYGIYNSSAATTTATNNYWGHDGGPSTTTPYIKGDKVSGKVSYEPWIREDNNFHFLVTYASTSVDADRNLQWSGTTKYSTEWDAAVAVWNAEGEINIEEDGILTDDDLAISDVSRSDVVWKGQWGDVKPDGILNPDTLKLNMYYLDHQTSSQIQNTITHELGHALGLDHSYLGNVLNFFQTSQTALGAQDISDYHFRW